MPWLWLMWPGEEEVRLEDQTWGGRVDQRHGTPFPGWHSLDWPAEPVLELRLQPFLCFSTSPQFSPVALDNCCRFYNHTVCA